MRSEDELVWLHVLQGNLAIKRDWVAVTHVQNLIDHMAGEYGFETGAAEETRSEVAVH